ncbi:flagellar biosynthetic protein FliR [Paraferrimonas sp. SM1919]|uniref:flagellar biosynthetic protein FliR n=1 Tax=Paraferrimonas sp. SM1919 TaxID=2662263 RepID=UPI0013D48E58|nr:flagellar biosynthetic protein FliR [Paraferrimonas sp. SM1919]
MLALSFGEIGAWLGQLWWPFMRVAACFMVMPIFNEAALPNRVRLGMALILAILVAPIVGQMPQVELLSINSLLLALEQALIGAMMGFVLLMLFAVMSNLGQILAMQMGMAMAVMNDPQNGISVAILGRMFLLFASLMFLALDGHLVAMDVVVASFTSWPVGTGMMAFEWHRLAGLFAWMLASSLVLALPAVAAMLLVNITFGVMNRSAPSINVFSLGFPMAMIFGLFSLFLSISGVPEHFTRLSNEALNLMASIVGAQ